MADNARDRLLQAIKDVDQEVLGERNSNEILTNYVVIYSHRRVTGEPSEDSDGVARLTMPGQAAWQTLGLLDAGTTWLRALYSDIGDDS